MTQNPINAPSPDLEQKIQALGWGGALQLNMPIYPKLDTLGLFLIKKDTEDFLVLRQAFEEGVISASSLPLIAEAALNAPFSPALWHVLFDFGLDINTPLYRQSSLLFVACTRMEENSLEEDPRIQYLLKKNPDVNLANEHGETPLLVTALFSPFSVPYLLEKGAIATAVCKDEYQTSNVLSCLLQGFDQYNNHLTEEEFTPLLDQLIEAGADPFFVDKDGDTLLFEAIRYCPITLPYLIGRGLHLDQPNHKGESPLMRLEALAHKKPEYQEYLEKAVEAHRQKLAKAIPKTSTAGFKGKHL